MLNRVQTRYVTWRICEKGILALISEKLKFIASLAIQVRIREKQK